MKCPLCKAVDADLKKEDPGVSHLHCKSCGAVTFSDVAWVELGSRTEDDKGLLAEHCRRHSHDPGFRMITHVRLREIIDEMSDKRASALLKTELNKKETGKKKQ